MFADGFVAEQLRQHVHEHHGCGLLAISAAFQKPCETVQCRHRQHRAFRRALRDVAAQGLPARVQVLHLRAVGGRLVEAQVVHVGIGKRQSEPVPEGEQSVILELFRLVRGHLALRRAHAVALLGLGEDHGGPAPVVHRGVIRRVNLDRVVAAALQPVDVLVGHVRHQLL